MRPAGIEPAQAVGSTRMTALRRFAFPLRLAWLRLTRRGERVLLVAFGIAAGAALLAAVLAGSLVAQDRSVERATARLPAQDRTVRLVWGGIASGPGTDVAKLDATSRRARDPRLAAAVREPDHARDLRVGPQLGAPVPHRPHAAAAAGERRRRACTRRRVRADLSQLHVGRAAPARSYPSLDDRPLRAPRDAGPLRAAGRVAALGPDRSDRRAPRRE